MIAVSDGAAPGFYVGSLLAMTTPLSWERFRDTTRERARQLGYNLIRIAEHEPELYRRGRWRTIRKGRNETATVVLDNGRRIEVKW